MGVTRFWLILFEGGRGVLRWERCAVQPKFDSASVDVFRVKVWGSIKQFEEILLSFHRKIYWRTDNVGIDVNGEFAFLLQRCKSL